MDIDSPPIDIGGSDAHAGHNHLELPEFSLGFPLPFRVLFLLGFAILLWATNLHILHLLGLDTSYILDFRDPDLPTPTPPLPSAGASAGGSGGGGGGRGRGAGTDTGGAEVYELDDEEQLGVQGQGRGRIERPPSSKLYSPVYKLFALYCAWVGGGWLLFRWISGGEEDGMERYRGLVGVIMLGTAMGAVMPWRGTGERERRGLRR